MPEQSVPPYRRIIERFRTRIATGELKPGARLPAIRPLARELGLDPGTVARAYAEMQREGLILNRRGDGTYVSQAATGDAAAQQRRARLGGVMDRALLEALGLGFGVEDIETAFTLRLADWRERRSHTARARATPRKLRSQTIRFHGSHDLAVELLASHLTTLHPSIRFETTFVGSLSGLMALGRKEADIAGAHLIDEDSGEFNIPFVRRILPEETAVLITLVERVQGLIVRPGNPKHIIGMRDLARPDVTFVNRQNGSGTRVLLDAQLRRHGILSARVKGYNREEKTHLAVAQAVGGGGADVGLGAQSAASVNGLDFIPLLKERYDLVVPKNALVSPPLSIIPGIVRSPSFRTMLASIPGYDTTTTGRMATVGPDTQRKEQP